MSGTKMPARRRAGRATSSASEPAGDGMVQAVYSYNDDNEELVNDSIAGAPSAADAAEPVSSAQVVAAERDAAERRAPGQRSEVLKAMDGENRPPNCGSGGHNHPKSPSNPLAADGAASTAGPLCPGPLNRPCRRGCLQNRLSTKMSACYPRVEQNRIVVGLPTRRGEHAQHGYEFHDVNIIISMVKTHHI